MSEPPLTIRELIQRRQQEGFVGRQRELEGFRSNLTLPVDDERRRFLFNIHGDAGVGKTFLIRRWRRLAEEQGAHCAYVDHSVYDLPGAMAAIAEDLRRQGSNLKTFTSRYETLKQRQYEVDIDAYAPRDASIFITKTAVKVGMRLAQDVPFVGAASELVNPDTIAEQADRLRVYLSQKFRSHEDVHLVLSPTEELSREFVSDLRHAAAKATIGLFFDTYERIADLIDPWLLDLFSSRYGDLPANLLVTVAGQRQLDRNRWANFLGLISDMPLAPFSDEESRQLMSRNGVTNPHVIDVILALSGRLPLLVAMLSETGPNDPAGVGDPSGSAVDRFLRWEEDERRREIALLAALPRRLNEDILAALVTQDDVGDLFPWLQARPFVTRLAGRCEYHQIVRQHILRLLYERSPQSWIVRHRLLAQRYADWRRSMEGQEDDNWANPRWREHRLEETYHQLCGEGSRVLQPVLGETVRALGATEAAGRQWAECLREAGQAGHDENVGRWGIQLLQHAEGDTDVGWASFLTLLIDQAGLQGATLALALTERAVFLRRSDDAALALKDLDRAIALQPSSVQAISQRAETNRLLQRHEMALADFEQAIQLDPENAWAIGSRGRCYVAMGRYDEAIVDFNRAIELNPARAWVIASRGRSYVAIGQYKKALADFNHAIKLNPAYLWAIASRGQTYRLMWRHKEALADFNRAIELNAAHLWTIVGRGDPYQLIRQYKERLSDFSHAVELDRTEEWAVPGRPETHRSIRHGDDAQANVELALDSANAWAIASRGESYLLTHCHVEAQADFDRAIQLDPDDDWYHFSRALVDLKRGLDEAAQIELRIAVELADARLLREPHHVRILFNAALYRVALGDLDIVRHLYETGIRAGATAHQLRVAARDLRLLAIVIGPSSEISNLVALLQPH